MSANGLFSPGMSAVIDYTFTCALASTQAVPEPVSLARVGIAGVAACAARRRRR